MGAIPSLSLEPVLSSHGSGSGCELRIWEFPEIIRVPSFKVLL